MEQMELKRYRLTSKLTDFNWYDGIGKEKEYNYKDYPAVHHGHRKEEGVRYEISFYKIPEKRVKKSCIVLEFDNDANFYRVRSAWSKTSFRKRELYKYALEALEELKELGYAEVKKC